MGVRLILFVDGRQEAESCLKAKWEKELEYRLIKELWAFTDNRITVRYAYEWQDKNADWFRSYGNENWEFDNNGLMMNRFACINDLAINGIRTKISLAARTSPG